MTGQFEYLRARDLKPGMKVKLGQLRYIYEIFIILSDTTNNTKHDEITGTVEFVGKEVPPEIFAKSSESDWGYYINAYDEREAFDSEELDLLEKCSEL